MAMIGFVDWSQIEVRDEKNFGRSGGNSIFLTFSPGKYRIRCLGQPYFFLQTFIPKKLTGAEKDIAIISPGPDEDPLIKLHIEPQQRGAINVLHRDDGNKLKVMRFGSAIYKHIRNYAVETGIDPANPKTGIDFLITVSDPGGNARNRQYVVTPLNATPITKEEAKKIKEAEGLYDLEKMFSPTPLEKLNEYIEQYNLIDKSSSTSGESANFDDEPKEKTASLSKANVEEGNEEEEAEGDKEEEDFNF